MPNDTIKPNAADRLTRYQFKKTEKEEKTTKMAEASKPAAKPGAANSSTGAADASANNNMERILQSIMQSNQEIRGEILQMRKDVQEFNGQTKDSFTRLETSVGGLSAQLTKLEKRVVDTEERVRVTEETTTVHGRAIGFLLQREEQLMEQYEDLQNRARRQNLRLYQVPEGCEKGDMVGFVRKLFPMVLTDLPLTEEDIKIDRAHRALMQKPKENDPPRSIVVRFADYTVKEQILRAAWAQRTVMLKMEDINRQIYLDNDYSPELQRKRAQVRYVIKQLKQKNVKARCLYPARLRMVVGSEEKTFQTLMDAAPTLRDMNIHIRIDERDKMERALTRHRWERQDSRGRRRNTNILLTEDECRFFFP